jgi:hypothetical protein
MFDLGRHIQWLGGDIYCGSAWWETARDKEYLLRGNLSREYFLIGTHMPIQRQVLVDVLLQCGDIHPNPGPAAVLPTTDGCRATKDPNDHMMNDNECKGMHMTSSKVTAPVIQQSDKLNILNWNCRGIDKQTGTPTHFP